jgi:hypothetical protein
MSIIATVPFQPAAAMSVEEAAMRAPAAPLRIGALMQVKPRELRTC